MAHQQLSEAQAFFQEAVKLKAAGKLADCCAFLVEGLRNLCKTDEERLPYFALLSTVVPELTFEDYIFRDVYIPTSLQFWANVLLYLATNKLWSSVAFYVIGLNRDKLWPLERLAANAPTSGIRVSSLLTHLSDADLKTWGIQLAICILKKGASVESIVVDNSETVPVAAVKIAVKTGNNDLFKYVMENSSKVRLQIDNKDKNGNTPLHILVKSGKVNSFSGVALLKLLLSYGASVSILDSAGKLAIDYIDSKMPAYASLQPLKSFKETDLKHMVRTTKEKGNKCLQNKDSFGALRHYKEAINLAEKAPDLHQDLAILHTNCSTVNLKLGLYKDALAAAEVAVKYDPTYYKSYWKMGQCYTSLQEEKDGLTTYVKALTHAKMDEVVTVNFLFAAAELLPLLDEKGLPYSEEVKTALHSFNEHLPKLLTKLLKSSSFKSIRSLILGPSYISFKSRGGIEVLLQHYSLMNSGLTAQLKADNVELGPFLKYPEHEWMDELVIILMLNSAKYDSLTTSQGDTPLHAAVGFCIQAGSSLLIEYILKHQTRPEDVNNLQDLNGQTLFHKICQCCPTGESVIGCQMTDLLLRLNFNPVVENSEHKTASQLVPKKSSLHQLLTSETSAFVERNGEKLKEEGKTEFKNGNYMHAEAKYTAAIDLVTKTTGDNHTLAILYGNRAECFLKMDKPQDALRDSKRSAAHDRDWHRAHWRLAKSFRGLRKYTDAANSYADTWNCLTNECNKSIKEEILSDLLATMIKIPEGTRFGIFNKLQGIKGDMIMVQLTYTMIEKGRWQEAEIAHSLLSLPGGVYVLAYNLKPLCNIALLQQHPWVVHFMVLLLAHGSDHHTLIFPKIDTYLHSGLLTVVITGIANALLWLIDNIAVPAKEMNVQDSKGNTILHMIASIRCRPDIKYNLIHLLLSKGIDPQKLNLNQCAARDVLKEPDPQILALFDQAMHDVPKHGSVPSGGLTEGKKMKKKKSAANMGGHDCRECDIAFSKALLHVNSNDYLAAVETFVSILLSKGEGSRHREVVSKTIDGIVEILRERTYVQELPLSMRNIKTSQMKTVIENLAKTDKWKQVLLLVDHYGESKLAKSFAKYISVTSLIVSSSPSESLKLKLMAILQRHGANISREKNNHEALKQAFQKDELQVVLQLLECGVPPSSISYTPGDTPLHAALMVAIDKGDFSIFEKLLKLHSDDRRKFSYLDPKCVDNRGETLLHAACRKPFSKSSLKAVEVLCEFQVPAHATSKEGKRPIEYLLDRNDRRAQYLRVIGGTAQSTTREKKREISEVSVSANDFGEKTLQPNTETGLDSQYGRNRKVISERKDFSASVLKEKVKQIILERPDAPNIFYGEQKEKMPTKTSAMSQNKKPSKKKLSVKPEATKTKDALKRDEIKSFLQSHAVNIGNLTWEVECTSEIIQFLKDTDVSLELKYDVVKKLNGLATGMLKPNQFKPVVNIPESLQLFKVAVGNNGTLIWEIGVAFSSRCSEDPEKRLKQGEHMFVVKGGRIYSEVIRIWNIVFGSDETVMDAINKVVTSHTKGKQCLLKRTLIQAPKVMTQKHQRVPTLFTEKDEISVKNTQEDQLELQFYPPASHNKTEYTIIKFYSFSAGVFKSIIRDTEADIEFPFRVTDIEQSIIQLDSDAPILLLGRSGTGKTTCCMFRLWTNFISYWNEALTLGVPFLPRTDLFEEDHDDTQNTDEDSEKKSGKDEDNIPPSNTDREDTLQLPETEKHQASPSHSNAEETSNDMEDTVEVLGDEKEMENLCEEEQHVEDNEDKREDESDDDDLTDQMHDHLHQIFVTKNPVLCAEVHKNFYQLCHAYEELSDHFERQDEDTPPKLQNIDDFSYPLFLTSKQLLLMLDASLGPPHFFDRNEDGSLNVRIKGWGSEEHLSELSLFSFESENETKTEENESDTSVPNDVNAEQNKPHTELKSDTRKEVTYDFFVEKVYPKIVKGLPNVYHPSLVWTEIMSFIKGSFEALGKPAGHLSKEEYMDLGRKQAPNFSGERDIVYDLYQRYSHYKKQNFLFDESDLVQNINNRMKGMNEKPWVIHQLYVDETQDFTQSELFLLVRIIQHPNDMFLTGDTAQGIMRGISFRFRDLKSLFFHARSQLRPVGETKPICVPKEIYQLTHNYRSHAGILFLASAILDILVEFFPESFDRLEPDQGLFMGPQPILLESCSHGDLAVLLQGNKRKTSHIEFGAHQAIIVVNEAVRNSMPRDLSHGIVLTIYEAKGLEFDDVLLYNFFKDSQTTKEWRVVTSFLHRLAQESEKTKGTDNLVTINMDVLQQAEGARPLIFDSSQHKLLNSELKHLYTALTRARVNVWIFDEDEEKRAPMFEYFKARQLVRCITEKDIEVGALEDTVFAEKSTPEDWITRAEEMMGRRLYEVAAKCYKMGHAEEKQRVALAYHQALKATRCQDNQRQRKDEFLLAAEKFLDCSEDMKAAHCLQNAREFELASLLYEKSGSLLKGAKIYHICNKPFDESRCLEQLGHFDAAIDVLSRAELYDQAIDCLNRYTLLTENMKRERKPIPPILMEHKPDNRFTVERLAYKAAKLYKKDDREKLMEALERLPRVEDRIDFLKNNSFVEEAASLMVKEGRVADAVKVLLQHGSVGEALTLARNNDDKHILGDCHRAQAVSDMFKEDTVTDDIVAHLDQAYTFYSSVGKRNDAGITKLIKARFITSKEEAESALNSFKNLKPFANEAGMLEALDVILYTNQMANTHVFADIKVLIQGVECLFSVIQAVMKPFSRDMRVRSQLYLDFYGLHQKDMKTLVIYPKQLPLCVGIMSKFLTSAEEQCPHVEKDRREICTLLSIHLIEVLNRWAKYIKDHILLFITEHLQCPSFKQGRECVDNSCAYLHRLYTEETAFSTLEALVWKVQFDRFLQKGIKGLELQTNDDDLRKLFMKINVHHKEQSFESCENLLDFLVPEHQQMTFLTGNKINRYLHLLTSGTVPEQVHEYLEHLWGDGKSTPAEELLLERSKNTDWFLRATLFAPLFQLKLNIVGYYESLEKDVALSQPEWLFRRKTAHALIVEIDDREVYVESLGRYLFEVHLWLKESPFKAVIEYMKCVRFLCRKDTFSVFPRISMFLLWTELFISTAFFIIAKLSPTKQTFVIPASYLCTLSWFNSSLSKDSFEIEEGIQRDTKKKENIVVMQDCVFKICEVLHGYKLNLLKRLFSPKKNAEIKFLLAERCFMLSLLLCSNSDVFVSSRLKTALMKTILSIELPADAPERLTKMMKTAKTAKNTRDAAEALDKFLIAKGENLLACQWESRGTRHVSTNNVTNIKEEIVLEMFHSEQGEKPAERSESVSEEDEKESFITNEEKEKRFYEQQKPQLDMMRNQAARTLQRFFRWLTMIGRLEHSSEDSETVIERCVQQQLREFQITDTICGVCGTSLQKCKDESFNSDVTKEENDETSIPSLMFESDRVLPFVSLEIHLSTDEHKKRLVQFQSFEDFYRIPFVREIAEMRLFIVEKRLKDETFVTENYSDLELEVSRLVRQMTDITKLLESVLSGREFHQTPGLQEKWCTLKDDFSRIKPEIKSRFEAKGQDVISKAPDLNAETLSQDKEVYDEEEMFGPLKSPKQTPDPTGQPGPSRKKKSKHPKRQKHQRDYDRENPPPRMLKNQQNRIINEKRKLAAKQFQQNRHKPQN